MIIPKMNQMIAASQVSKESWASITTHKITEMIGTLGRTIYALQSLPVGNVILYRSQEVSSISRQEIIVLGIDFISDKGIQIVVLLDSSLVSQLV